MSPESLYGSVDSVKGDIWSVGTQYTLRFGNIPKLMRFILGITGLQMVDGVPPYHELHPARVCSYILRIS